MRRALSTIWYVLQVVAIVLSWATPADAQSGQPSVLDSYFALSPSKKAIAEEAMLRYTVSIERSDGRTVHTTDPEWTFAVSATTDCNREVIRGFIGNTITDAQSAADAKAACLRRKVRESRFALNVFLRKN